MNKHIIAMYFSATDTTKKIVAEISRKISEQLGVDTAIKTIDFTLPEARLQTVSFSDQDLVIFGTPVYAGRVPNVLVKYIAAIQGCGALAVPVVVYGNRNYDDALIELKDILEGNGFKTIAAGAFVGEHAFSDTLAKGRPDEKDLDAAREFAARICEKIRTNGKMPIPGVTVKGNQPYRKHYMPKNKEGVPVDIRKVTPKTSDQCTDCKLCAQLCPMGSIDWDDVSRLNGICIKCGACIKKCPSRAKYFDDSDFLRHKEELEIEYTARKEPELFI